MRTLMEDREDRLAMVEDAGWGRLSMYSVVAGILIGYGAFALLAGVTAGVLGAMNIDVDLTGADLARTGTAGGVVLGIVLLASWYFAGYTAGRMARRAGVTHGVFVFVLGVLVAVAAASTVEALGATDDVVAGLERLGVPTTSDQWSDIGTVAGIASLLGMLLGSLLGGAAGERWHAKLVTRALDPAVGPEAYARVARKRALQTRTRRRDQEDGECDIDVDQIDLTAPPEPAQAGVAPAPGVATGTQMGPPPRKPAARRNGKGSRQPAPPRTDRKGGRA